MALDKEAVNKWKDQYFQEIKFPIIIFSNKDYLAVSDLEEYYYDIDINIWSIGDGPR